MQTGIRYKKFVNQMELELEVELELEQGKDAKMIKITT